MDELRSAPVETTGPDAEPGWRVQWKRLKCVRWGEWKALMNTAMNNWFTHNAPRLGASLAFYTLLSLAPLLIIVVAVAGAVFGREAAEGQLVWQIQDLIGREGAITIQAMLRGTQQPGAGTIASVIGVLALLYGATSVVAELRDALNTIWCVPRKEQTGIRSLLAILVERTISLAMVLAVGFLLLVSLTINAALSAVGKRFQWWLPSPEYVLQAVDFLITYFVIAGIFLLIYKFVPDLRLEWRDVIPGALVTALLFGVGRTLIGMYLGKAGVGSTYGAAGSLVLILFWVYYSAQIFFFGAEFTQAYAQHFGSRPCDRIGREVQIVDRDQPAPAGGGEPVVRLS
jgi:membrane protein